MYNASYFESRVSNASDLEPFFHNSTNFESKILERVICRRKKCFAPHEVLKWNWFVQNRHWWMFCFQKVTFLDLISPWKRQLLQLCVFSKTINWWKEWKKSQFPFKTFEKNQILKQDFNNVSDFEWRISKYVRLLFNSTQLLTFWTGVFTVCRIVKHLFYHTSDFEQKFQQHNRFSREIRFEKSNSLGQFPLKNFIIFWSIYILKMSKIAFSHFLGKLVSELVSVALFLPKKTSFESKILKRVRFWIIFFTTQQTLKQKIYFVLKFELNFLIASELESRFLQRIRFCSKNCF